MTLNQVLRQAITKLKNKSTSPTLDAEVLLAFVLKKDRQFILLHPEKKLTKKQILNYYIVIRKRQTGWPIAYIVGKKSFFSLDFQVNSNVLIPRPETETFVEIILTTLRYSNLVRILDIGTGSGCIIASIARTLGPNNKYFASDVSTKALTVARKNFYSLGVKVKTKKSDMFKNWGSKKFDVVVANLPYLPKLNDHIKFEPRLALLSKKNGLDLIEKLFNQISKLPYQPEIFLEFGHDHATPIKKLAKKYLPAFKIKLFNDLRGIQRFAQVVPKTSSI